MKMGNFNFVEKVFPQAIVANGIAKFVALICVFVAIILMIYSQFKAGLIVAGVGGIIFIVVLYLERMSTVSF